MQTYSVEVIWNRSFSFMLYAYCGSLKTALKVVKELVDSGDGERVKSTRILDQNGRILFIDGYRALAKCKT